MLADEAVDDWTRQVEETADRLARDALQQLHNTAQPRPSQPPVGRSTLPPGLFDPTLLNYPLPSQPPERAHRVAKLAAVTASLPAARPPTVLCESASLLSAVDAVLAEAEAVLKREQAVNDTEQMESKQMERRQQRVERHTAAAQLSETRQQHRQPASHSKQHTAPTSHNTFTTSTIHTPTTPHTKSISALQSQASHSAEIIRIKKAIELRTEQRRRERDEAVKAEMLDRQRRDIIARYEEVEGKRREEERREQEEVQLKEQLETQTKQQQDQQHKEEEESKRQQLKQELEDKKRLAAEAIRQQRQLVKHQQQQQLLAQYTKTLQRRADKRLLQQAWQQWLTAVLEARRSKQSKAVSVWRYNCTVRYFRLWRSVVGHARGERRRVAEESMRRRKEDRRVQAEAHWKLNGTQRSDTVTQRKLLTERLLCNSLSHVHMLVSALWIGCSLRGGGACKCRVSLSHTSISRACCLTTNC